MKHGIPQLIIMLAGVLLVLLGTYLGFFPLRSTSTVPPSGKLEFQRDPLIFITDHVYIALVVVGAVLLVLGFWGPGKWPRGRNSN